MNLEELHDILFDIICTIDDICKKEGIRYFLDSGTELGAVREGDFIEWDDDMDIKVLAEDYEAFKEAMIKNLPPHMHLSEPDDMSPAFYDFVVRIYDERFFLRDENDEKEKYYKNIQNHVGTDVFIFSKAKNKAEAKRKIYVNRLLYLLAMGHRYELEDDKYTAFQKFCVNLLTFFGKRISMNKIYKLWWDNALINDIDDPAYRIGANFIPRELGYLFFNEDYLDVSYASIRGRDFPVPKGYDRELTTMYGDYMTPVRDDSLYEQHLY